jgi:hypothetical protein
MNEIWLSEHIFSWPIKVEGGIVGDLRKTAQPYRLLRQAEQSLKNAATSPSPADAVAGAYRHLRCAVHDRLELIEHCYAISGLFPSSTGPLARLEALGLAKPVVTQHLLALTDDADPLDAATPHASRLKALLEIAWYFLKATDPVCKLIRTSVAYEQDFVLDTNTPPLKFTAEVSPLHTQQLRIFGWFSSNCFRPAPAAGFPMHMQVAYAKDRSNGAAPTRPIVLSEREPQADPDRWLDGTIEPGSARMLQFWNSNFEQQA